MHNLFSMGGYGIYIYSAYGITLTVLGINLYQVLQEKNRVQKILKQYFKKLSA